MLHPCHPTPGFCLGRQTGMAVKLIHAPCPPVPSPSCQHLVLAGVGGACKVFLATAARTSVSGREHMAAALERAPGRGLLTVSNHVGSIDDPLITASSELAPPPRLLVSAVETRLCRHSDCW
jgi:monolysocardiolipin acyltransferase